MLHFLLVFNEEDKDSLTKASSVQKQKSRSAREDIWIIVFVILLYTATCGSERLFQSMEFTFGFCGPLKLDPQDAVFTDECYNGGFMFGRYITLKMTNFDH